MKQKLIRIHPLQKNRVSQTSIRKKPKRQFGILKEKIKIAKDFDAPLPEDVLANFENI